MDTIEAIITKLAEDSKDVVSVQCNLHPDWRCPYWRVYIGTHCHGAGEYLETALAEARDAVAARASDGRG